jgi:hypothetical protein
MAASSDMSSFSYRSDNDSEVSDIDIGLVDHSWNTHCTMHEVERHLLPRF